MFILQNIPPAGQAGIRLQIRQWLSVLCIWLSCAGFAQATTSTTNWGVIPLEQAITLTFANQDLTKNFTDQYLFTLSSSTGTTYNVLVSYDSCTNGCGNAAVDYAIYEQNGKLINDSGSAVLQAGDYNFQLKGTGMGAGNEVAYSGTITFGAGTSSAVTTVTSVTSASSTSAVTSTASSRPVTTVASSGAVTAFVSAVPEPGEWALMLTSTCLLAFGLWRHRQRVAASLMPPVRWAA